MLKCRLCSFLRFNLELKGDADHVFNDILRWVEDLAEINGFIYFRTTLKVRTTSLDVMRFVGRASKLPNLLRVRVNDPIFYELLNELMKSAIIKPSLEFTVSTLRFDTLVGTYIGDLYLSETITPISYALTLLEIKSEYVVFDEVRFNICAISKDFKIVGCLIPHTSKHFDLSILQSVVTSLKGIIDGLNTQRRVLTWILSQNELHVVDY